MNDLLDVLGTWCAELKPVDRALTRLTVGAGKILAEVVLV